MKKSFSEHLNEVDGDCGYSIDSISDNDLNLFRRVISLNYRNNLLNASFPQDKINHSIDKYHEVSHLVDHKSLWTKINRILCPQEYTLFLNSEFFTKLKSDLGYIAISDEENIGYPEIYYRLVRPLPSLDVGPLHADRWFWDLGHGVMPANENFRRIKFWCSLWNSNGDTGFRFVSGSHKKEYKYSSEVRDGFAKPMFDENSYSLKITNMQGSPGSLIIFHDKLLHGGYPTSNSTRVSFEFTLFVKERTNS